MKKWIFSLLSVLALCLALLSATALAAGEHNDHSGWKPLSGTLDTISLESGNSYYLSGDVTVNSPITVTGTVTLCLNGHVLDLGGQNISVDGGANFTLCDCNSTNQNHKFLVGTDGLWKLDETNGTEALTGGVITGGSGAPGGGVCVDGGTFTMDGGNLAGNTANLYGGGVYVGAFSKFTMTGGTITGNSAGFGGGVCMISNSTFNLSGSPTITGNTMEDQTTVSNVYMSPGIIITIAGELTNSTSTPSIGVSHPGSFRGWSNYMSSKDPADYFFSDDSAYGVALENGEAILKTWDYTVTFDPNGGSGTMASQGFFADETKTLTANAFTRTGCTFNGWSTTEGGTVSYRDKAEVKNLTAEQNGTVTLYAVWSTTRYTISYQDVEGVTNVGELPTTHTYGTNTVIPDPTRTG